MAGDPNSGGFEFFLNGRPTRAQGFSPETTLLDFIRSHGLTGAKEGCAEGECGACTVLIMKSRVETGEPVCVPVNSCLVFLPQVAGHEIYTVEALANGGLSPVQQAMADYGGSQCGYCTPGFVASMFAEYHRPGRTGPCDPHALGGNLCRCTGYRPIRDAALSLPTPAEPCSIFAPRAASIEPVECEGFSRPGNLADCLALLARDPQAKLVAGATDLAVESNLRWRRWSHLVSVEGIPELRHFHDSPEAVEFGAALTISEIAEAWHAAPPVWHEWLPLFASPLLRNRATLGGNMATASPIGDGAPLLLALDARVRIASPSGIRTVPLDRFFTAYRKTALEPGELLVSIVIPKPFPAIVRFYKAAKRRMDDISTVAACFALDLDSSGRVRQARLAYGGVAPTPVRVTAAEDALAGLRWDLDAVARAQEVLARTLHPISDHRGSAAYRAALGQSLIEKFWWEVSGEVAA